VLAYSLVLEFIVLDFDTAASALDDDLTVVDLAAVVDATVDLADFRLRGFDTTELICCLLLLPPLSLEVAVVVRARILTRRGGNNSSFSLDDDARHDFIDLL